MQFVRSMVKEMCTLVYRLDLRRQGMSERVISAKATWASKQMEGISIRDICGRTADKLQHCQEDLRVSIEIWKSLSSHPVGESDLWFHTYWLKDERISGDDRDKAFEAGQELIQKWIQLKYGFQTSALVRKAIERASWGTGDSKPLLIFTLLGPEDKAAFLDYALTGIPLEPAREDPVVEAEDDNQARGSGDLPYAADA